MSELVSVVITAYNSEKFLPEALDSVLNQTYQNFEMILVNDGSKDRTLEILKEYQQKDSRIVIDDHENMGISKSANRALRLAKGNIVIRMDSDDVMMPNRIEEQVKFLQENPAVTMVSCDAEFINERGETIGQQRMPGYDKVEDTYEALKADKLIACAHTGFAAYREKMLEVGGYNEKLKCVVDLDLFTRMVEKGNVLIIIRKNLMRYRMHGTSVMASGMKSMLLQNTIAWVIDSMLRRRQGKRELEYDEFLEVLESQSWWSKVDRKRRFYAYNYYRASGILFGNRKYAKAFMYVSLALALHPQRFIRKAYFHLKHKIQGSYSVSS